jgi:predicted SAM-dependent methyltransferase
LEANHNQKSQFEALPRVVHKRNTLQNMLMWEHERSDSVILGYMKLAHPKTKQQRWNMKRKTRALLKRIIPREYHRQFVDWYVKCRAFFLSLLYTGNKFECPFCGGHFRKFLPAGLDLPVFKEKNIVGGGYRVNVKCSRCRSSDRERLTYLYLKNKTELFDKNLKVLHVAPERNLQRVLMTCPNIDYLSVDLNSPLAMVRMDITEIKYKDNSFDVLICNHVLEHIPDDRKAMSELYRVLKPAGWAILQVPISLLLNKTYEDSTVTTPEEREKVFGQSNHVRIYGKDYKDRLEKIGFSVEVYNFVSEFGESTTHKYGLLKEEDMYICSKPRQKNI